MEKRTEVFEPIRLIEAPTYSGRANKVVVTTTLKGDAAEEFEKMCKESELTRSQLLLQMVHHCLNRTDDLKDLYRRLAILR